MIEQAGYVELWHKKDAALFQVHRMKRDGKKAKAVQAQAQADLVNVLLIDIN